MGEMAEFYGEQAEGQHEDEVNGTGGQMVWRENADGVLELTEEGLSDDPDDDDFDWDSIPQGKPGGERVGGNAERTTQTCTTCKGKGTYVVKSFTDPDESGQRRVVLIDQQCVVCNGTGKELVLT